MRRPITLGLLIAVAQYGCGGEKDRPPPLAGAGIANPVAGGVAPGAGGSPNAPGSGSDEGIELTGTVIELIDDTFTDSVPFTRPATVSAPGHATNLVQSEYDGEEFALEGVLKSAETWVRVEPLSGVDVMTTLQVVDTLSPVRIELLVGQAAVLEQILSDLTAPTSIESGAAQAVLFFTNVDGEPVSGVSVQASGAEVVAYADGTTWDVTRSETTANGIAFVANLTVSDSLADLDLSGAVDAPLRIQVAEDALTLVDILAP